MREKFSRRRKDLRLVILALFVVSILLGGGCLQQATNAKAEDINAKAERVLYYGDVNKDYKVTASDALAILRHEAEMTKLQGTRALDLADVNLDKKVTSADALEVLRMEVGLRAFVPYESGKEPDVPEPGEASKTLVVYFSCTGTTKRLAEYAADSVDADLVEIVPAQPYTEKDLAYYTDCRADREQADPTARPAIANTIENMETYEKIVLAYPIWHGQAPRIISTFLESYDFSGKTIVPFCTSHSSGIGSSDTNLHGLCPDTVIWREGKRFGSAATKEEITAWLAENGVTAEKEETR